MFKNKKGFSLIELMVVVAIVGILSAIAVPQFQKFQRKAKQSEARVNLAAVYTAQKTFLAETGTYYSNLWATGFEPEGDMKFVIGSSVGTAAGSPAGYTVSPYTHVEHLSTFTICSITYAGGISQNCRYSGSTVNFSLTGLSVAATATAFTTIAIAAQITIGGSTDDIWTINQRKELTNNQNGAL